MKKSIIYSSLIILAAMASCKNEDPFDSGMNRGEGRFLTSAITVDVKPEQMATRSVEVPTAEQFTVDFYNTENLDKPQASYQYSSMPEVVSLPVGAYIVKAHYGTDNAKPEFDSPYYYGESQEFNVEASKVVDTIDPIVCSLSQVKVSVLFDAELIKVMSEDAKVSVALGQQGALLDFFPNSEKDGYFPFVEGSNTLAATFYGTVEGTTISETKNYSDVKKGNYYRITFKLHSSNPEGNNNGQIAGGENGTLKVDATVTYHDPGDNGIDLSPDSESYLVDDMRPGQDNNSGGNVEDPGTEDPGEEEDPNDNPEIPEGAPEIVGVDPLDITKVNDLADFTDAQGNPIQCAVKIYTSSPITKFICTIDSQTLTADALDEVGLGSRLNLVEEEEPGQWANLKQLGFPTGAEITNPQEKEDDKYVILFDITKFASILNVFEGNHNFIFEVANASGETKTTLKLKGNG